MRPAVAELGMPGPPGSKCADAVNGTAAHQHHEHDAVNGSNGIATAGNDASTRACHAVDANGHTPGSNGVVHAGNAAPHSLGTNGSAARVDVAEAASASKPAAAVTVDESSAAAATAVSAESARSARPDGAQAATTPTPPTPMPGSRTPDAANAADSAAGSPVVDVDAAAASRDASAAPTPADTPVAAAAAATATINTTNCTVGSVPSERGRHRRRRRQTEVVYGARALGFDDDLLSALLVDTALGFETHKMAADPPRLAVDRRRLEAAMLRLGADGHVLGCYDRIFGTPRSADGDVLEEETEEHRGSLLPEGHAACAHRVRDPCFKQHALRYLRCFLPTAGFAIVPCLRYRIAGRCGAKIVTTRHW